jgi:ABC-type multidrug transport system ATPase subunit
MIPAISGKIELGEFVTAGYFEQESAAGNDNTALDELWQEYPGMTNFEVRAALASCGLTNEHITTKMMALSGGEAAKVRLCKIMQKPVNLLVLDEPFTGLDPLARIHFRELLRNLKERGKTIFFSSHELGETELLCDRVAIMKKGHCVYQGPVRDIAGDGATNLERLFLKTLGEAK